MPKIPSNDVLKKMMMNYYTKAKLIEKYLMWAPKSVRPPIAWITSGGPVELLVTMGVIPIYPENHGAMIGAKKMGVELSDVAESRGYSRDLCSYFRCDVGQAVTHKSPIPGGLPRPDFLLCCNNICGTVLKWYEVQARYYNVPLIFFDTPYNYYGETPELVDYVHNQFTELIPQLEKATNRKFNEKRFGTVIQHAAEGVQAWNDVLSSCTYTPAPMSAFDAFFYLAPIVTLRGTKASVDKYIQLKNELLDLAKKHVGAVENEQYRLVWDNIPIWYKVGRLSKTFAKYNACLVGDTYTNAWADNSFTTENPMREMARVYATIFLNKNIEDKTKNFVKLMKKYNADGFVLHSNRSCKPYSFGQLDIKEEVTRQTGAPGIMIEADMCDSRAYAEEQIETRIQAFMETLKERKSMA